MSQNDIQEIELTLEHAKKMVALGTSLERLMNNRDFKKLIREEYLEREAIRLVHLKCDPNMQSEESQKLILSQIDSIGALTTFLRHIEHQAMRAKMAIDDCEEELDRIRSGEDEEEFAV